MGVCIGAVAPITKPEKQTAQTAGSSATPGNAAELLKTAETNSRQFGGGMFITVFPAS